MAFFPGGGDEIIKSKHVIKLNIAKNFFYLPATDQAKEIIGAL